MKAPTMRKRLLFLLLVLDLNFFPAAAFAGPNIPGFYGSMGNLVQPSANQLPVIQSIVNGISGLEQVGGNNLVVHQEASKAVLDWESFDIGADASVYFDQQGNADWSALNRIYDKNPSRIFGKLTADGQIYLINQNGMLFGPGATVHVHSLAASSLNIADDDFLSNTMCFATENYMEMDGYDPDQAVVANHGMIYAQAGGEILLIGPHVENGGAVTVTAGRILMAAGESLTLSQEENNGTVENIVEIDGRGNVDNFSSGRLDAEMGEIGLYGKVVNQEGLIRAVTAVEQNGRIVLKAEETVHTGENSRIISTVSQADETYHESFPFTGGAVAIEAGQIIDHRGGITANSGTVTMTAGDMVYLAPDSLIDVSGNDVIASAEEQCIDVTLNSVELRDDQLQKDGILKGATVTISSFSGSGIGDISDYVEAEEMTAIERSSYGGAIDIQVTDGDIVMAENAHLDISGGATIYQAGVANTTRLVSGNRVYDISSAPSNLAYDVVSADLEYGGVNSLGSYVASATFGGDAGRIQLIAETIVMDGSIDGSVLTGDLQNLEEELEDDNGNTMTSGRVMPTGGTLIIGDGSKNEGKYYKTDAVVNAVTLADNVDSLSFASDFDPSADGPGLDSLRGGETLIDVHMLNDAELNRIDIYAQTTVTIDVDASLRLQENGGFTAEGRAVSHFGAITTPGGTVTLTSLSNISTDSVLYGTTTSNPDYIPAEEVGPERVYLASGSIIDVGGLQLDFSIDGATEAQTRNAFLDGGQIELTDKTVGGKGVVVNFDATVNVNGGYCMAADGVIAGGDAGKVAVAGPSIILNGNLKGYAIEGQNGGEIDLHAFSVAVVNEKDVVAVDDLLPDEVISDIDATLLTLSDTRFEETGFTAITLKSYTDLTVAENAELTPSNTVLVPVCAAQQNIPGTDDTNGSADTGGPDTIRLVDDRLCATVISLSAGSGFSDDSAYVTTVEEQDANQNALVRVADTASLKTAVLGTIDLSGPGMIVDGALDAPAGTIALTAGYDLSDTGLVLGENASIQAAAYNWSIPKGDPNEVANSVEPLDGGSVTVSAAGDLVLAQGSRIDVSAAPPVHLFVEEISGSPERISVTTDPGTISLSFGNAQDEQGHATLQGSLLGLAAREGRIGGSLEIHKLDQYSELAITPELARTIDAGGFDDLSLSSRNALAFPQSLNLEVGRRLVLDAPVIRGAVTDGQAVEVNLLATEVAMQNTYFPTAIPEGAQTGTLSVSGEYIRITGDVILDGFDWVSLSAKRDILLTDDYYLTSGGPTWIRETGWVGGLYTSADDLLLSAARIYTTTNSDFTLHTDGTLTTLPSATDVGTPTYSAYSRLTIEASIVDHRGYLAAPMGEILMGKAVTETAVTPADRIYLAEGSVLSTAGDASVYLGELDADGVLWSRVDKSSISTGASLSVDWTPENEIGIYADEIVAMDDSRVDVSGGGSIYTSLFQAGVEGSDNPLAGEGIYVILPDSPLLYPGETVYLEEGAGTAAGTYTLLPAEYAHVAGAVVIRDLGSTNAYTSRQVTKEGYDIVAGRAVVMGSDLIVGRQHQYSVRAAEDVLAEGNFTVVSSTAGDGGNLTVAGKTTILQGTVTTGALEEYQNGTLALSGESILVGDGSRRLSEWFSATDTIPSDMQGQLYISSDSLNAEGNVQVGDEQTRSVTVTQDSRIDADNLTISASELILIEAGSSISTTESGGDLMFLVTDGRLAVDGEAALLMGGDLTLDAGEIDFSGTLEMNQGLLTLAGDRLIVAADAGAIETGTQGTVVSSALWQHFSDVERVSLTSRSDILFAGDLDLTVQDELIVSALGISGTGIENGVNLQAETIRFKNSDGSLLSRGDIPDTGVINLAANDIYFMGADVSFDGFLRVNLKSTGDTVFAGQGSLDVSGDLYPEAARWTTDILEESDPDGGLLYTVADYRVSVPAGTIVTTTSGGAYGETAADGGSLTLEAMAIDHGGVIQTTAGQVHLSATGEDGGEILLRAGSKITSRGSDAAPGGEIYLSSAHGSIHMASGALVDVSAGNQGDAGGISFIFPEKEIRLNGEISGAGNAGGDGGTFVLDTLSLADLSPVIEMLGSGGFDETIQIRTRQGGLLIDETDTLSARHIRLEADGDAITVGGTIDAAWEDGAGSAALYAGTDLVLESGSRISAAGTGVGGSGGGVTLAADTGMLTFEEGATINVGGGSAGEDGTIWFRSRQNGTDINMRLGGTIAGAGQVYAEAFRVYDEIYTLENNLPTGTAQKGVLYLETVSEDSAEFVDNLAWGHTLDGIESERFHLVAGVEARSSGDVTVAEDWNLTTARFGKENDIIGALTLRAAGNVDVEAGIIDQPTASPDQLVPSAGADTWQLNLVAGAESTAARALATQSDGTVDRPTLTIADNSALYSESGAIQLASAGDLNILGNQSVRYVTTNPMSLSVGTYDQDIAITAGGNILLKGGIIQSSAGSISATVAGDLTLRRKNNDILGSIRTIGTASKSGVRDYWEYTGGGDITIVTGGEIYGLPKDESWDAIDYVMDPETLQAIPVWYAAYGRNATEGIAAMAGGDITIACGSGITAPVGIFREGDLSVFSGGHIDGRFLVYDGIGTLDAMGCVGSRLDSTKQAIELFDAAMTVTAQGDITVGTIINPLAAETSISDWCLGYTEQTGVSLDAVTGSVFLWGDDDYHESISSGTYKKKLLPATVSVTAGQNIVIGSDFYLAPAADGNLILTAGQDIYGESEMSLYRVYMTDVDPDTLYGHQPDVYASENAMTNYLRVGHATTPVHGGDMQPAVIDAGNDVKNLMLYSAESMTMTAGHDIQNIYLQAQNVKSEAITTVVAGNDIYFASLSADQGIGGGGQLRGIEVGGPGLLYVQAGNDIDLGTTKGIQAVGSLYNPALRTEDNSVIVLAGTGDTLDLSTIEEFFVELRLKGKAYSVLNAQGDGDAATAIVDEIQETLIDPLFETDASAAAEEGEASTGGNIDMIHSQINSQGSAGDIYIVAAGELNVGTSTWDEGGNSGEDTDTGIFTTSGGDINIFVEKDLNVNESRVMTFAGGDILTWSNTGNINAGRGSRTAVNAGDSHVEYQYDASGNLKSIEVIFDPPAVGSGIRTLTFDPDGVAGPETEPEPGDLFLFAPSGEIDAGEAGISGKNVVLGAVAIVNAQNIDVDGSSVGVPDASASAGSLSALAGSGAVSETSNVADTQTGLANAQDRFSSYVADLTETLVPKWVAVEVVGFGEEEEEEKQ